MCITAVLLRPINLVFNQMTLLNITFIKLAALILLRPLLLVLLLEHVYLSSIGTLDAIRILELPRATEPREELLGFLAVPVGLLTVD